jgi:hypothetical protein
MRSGLFIAALLSGALALVGCGSSSSSSSSSSTSSSSTPATSTAAPSGSSTTAAAATPGPEGIPLEQGAPLAPASTTSPGTKIDGVIQCAPLEQLAYHIHIHLQVYDDGKPRSLPAAIGLLGPVSQQTQYGPFYGASKCYYWLHTHASDGIIHVESPTPRIYTLGMFFDEWRQPLSSTQVASVSGKVTAYLNGKVWKASPRLIPLQPHNQIQLDVGKPLVPFTPISFAGTSL